MSFEFVAYSKNWFYVACNLHFSCEREKEKERDRRKRCAMFKKHPFVASYVILEKNNSIDLVRSDRYSVGGANFRAFSN